MRYLYVLTWTHLENSGVEWENQLVNGYKESHCIYVHYKILQSNALNHMLFADRCLCCMPVKTQCMHTHRICCSVTKYLGSLSDLDGFLGRFRLSKLPQRYVKNREGSRTIEGILQLIDKRANPPGTQNTWWKNPRALKGETEKPDVLVRDLNTPLSDRATY